MRRLRMSKASLLNATCDYQIVETKERRGLWLERGMSVDLCSRRRGAHNQCMLWQSDVLCCRKGSGCLRIHLQLLINKPGRKASSTLLVSDHPIFFENSRRQAAKWLGGVVLTRTTLWKVGWVIKLRKINSWNGSPISNCYNWMI